MKQTSWIDFNKGDKNHKNYRSPLVTKEFLGSAVDDHQHNGNSGQGMKLEEKVIVINDVTSAFLMAPIQRFGSVEMPFEGDTADRGAGQGVGLLERSLCGAPDGKLPVGEEGFELTRLALSSPRASWIQCATKKITT